jgi:phenolic acid decarboxylase
MFYFWSIDFDEPDILTCIQNDSIAVNNSLDEKGILR